MDTHTAQFLGAVLAAISLSFLYARVVLEIRQATRHPHAKGGK